MDIGLGGFLWLGGWLVVAVGALVFGNIMFSDSLKQEPEDSVLRTRRMRFAIRFGMFGVAMIVYSFFYGVYVMSTADTY